jgi:hypothetical protein
LKDQFAQFTARRAKRMDALSDLHRVNCGSPGGAFLLSRKNHYF